MARYRSAPRAHVPAVLIATAVALAAPAVAEAATRCVPAGGPGCTTSHATIAAAVGAAIDGDTVSIAAGSYPEAISTAKRLHFAGAGAGTLASAAGATTIAPAVGIALNLSGGGSVRSLRAVGASGWIGSTALWLAPSTNGTFDYAVGDVLAFGGDSTDVVFGSPGSGLTAFSTDAGKVMTLDVDDSHLQAGSGLSFLPGVGASVSGAALTATFDRSTAVGSSGNGQGLLLSPGQATVTDSTLRGAIATSVQDGDVTLARTRVEGTGNAIVVLGGPVVLPDTRLTLVDSLVTTAPVAGVAEAYAVAAQTNDASGPASVLVRGSTLIARGEDPDGAVSVVRTTAASPPVSLDLKNSVARMEGPVEAPAEGDVVVNRGVVSASSSHFSSVAFFAGGSFPEPGVGTNVAGDPDLDADFSPLPGSPLVDRGDVAFLALGELDLLGRPRNVDFDANGVAAPDIGAFELQLPPAPPATPTTPSPPSKPPNVSGFSLLRKRFTARAPRHRGRKRGTAFRFTLDEAADVAIVLERELPGRRVRVKGKPRCVKPTRSNRAKRRCARRARAGKLSRPAKTGANSIPFSGKLAGRHLAPGGYRATLTATDATGLRSDPLRFAFRVLSP
jgi:hypothetical protein